MPLQTKKKVLFIASLLAFLMVVLAFSLTGLQLLPGQPLFLGGSDAGVGGAANLGSGEIFLLILRGFLALLLVCLPIYVLMSLLTPQGRRRLLIDIILISIVLGAALALSKYADQPVEEAQQQEMPAQQFGQGLPSGEATGEEPPTYEPQAQNWMVTLTVLTVALVLAVFLFFIFRRVLRSKRSPTELQQLAENAQQAIKSIGLGLNFENIILQCYLEMSQTIQQSRGLQRGDAMTPLEFQQYLEKSGVPSGPVRKLTRLFENVRYGHLQVGDQGKREAVESLNQIIAYCRSLG